MPALDQLNILIVCEHASDMFGGEAVLPLRYFQLLEQRGYNVYLLTHERVRARLEHLHGLTKQNVYYIPDTKLHVLLHHISSKIPDRVSVITVGALMHLLTQCYQRVLAKKIVRTRHIDIIHEPSPVSPRQPSMMFGMGCPVVIGPMNGGMDFPPCFSNMSSKVERMLYSAVRLISNIFNVLIPGKLFATLLLVANERTKAALPRFRRGEVLELVENAVFRNQVRSEESFSVKTDDQQIIVLFVGRLVDLKMLDIVILAIASCQTSNIQLTVVGDGPSGKKWRELARRLLGDRVKFVGWVANDKIMEVYDAADIFVLPSVRECGGAVVLEAMARGLPVVAVDWGGPADYVDSKTGFLVRPESKDSMIKDFSRYIDVLSADCSLRKRLGNAAIEKIKDKFTWETKIEAILVAYNNVLQCRL